MARRPLSRVVGKRRSGTDSSPAAMAGRMADTVLRFAARNMRIQRLLRGRAASYRRSLMLFLLAALDPRAQAQAAVLLAQAHRGMPVSASDFELIRYWMLTASERHGLATDVRARIAGALAAARSVVVASPPAVAPSVAASWTPTARWTVPPARLGNPGHFRRRV